MISLELRGSGGRSLAQAIAARHRRLSNKGKKHRTLCAVLTRPSWLDLAACAVFHGVSRG
jgi:hypothetical protein